MISEILISSADIFSGITKIIKKHINLFTRSHLPLFYFSIKARGIANKIYEKKRIPKVSLMSLKYAKIRTSGGLESIYFEGGVLVLWVLSKKLYPIHISCFNVYSQTANFIDRIKLII